jgi:hypothetical protein
MIRWAERCRAIRLARVEATGNCADIMTKCLTGTTFFRHRSTIPGLPQPPPVPVELTPN